MKEKLNLIEILRDAPIGIEFYSIVHETVELVGVVNDVRPDYPIMLKAGTKRFSLSSEGTLIKGIGECIIYPSKENRDWSTFEIDYPQRTKMMCSDNGIDWNLRLYIGKKICYYGASADVDYTWKYVVPLSDFDFENLENNINKSI